MENSINQRVRIAIESSNFRSINAFSKATGLVQQTLSSCVNEKKEPRASLLMSVLKGLPDLSAEWLMRGEGEMWRSDIKISGDQKAEGGSVLVGHGSEVGSIANNAPSALNLQENERLRAEVQHHKETIKELKEQNGFLKEQLKTSLQTVANLTSK